MKVVVDLYHDGSNQFVETRRSTFPAVTFEGVRSREEQKQAIRDAEVYNDLDSPGILSSVHRFWIHSRDTTSQLADARVEFRSGC